MLKINKTDINGRSMIEMLGVLSVVGVLSMGGIAGYSKAMSVYRTNKLLDQINSSIADTRDAYAEADSFSGFGKSIIIDFELVPSSCLDYSACTGTITTSCTKIKNAFGGNIWGDYSRNNSELHNVVYLGFNDIPKEACIKAATMEFGDKYTRILINGPFSTGRNHPALWLSQISISQASEKCNQASNEIVFAFR